MSRNEKEYSLYLDDSVLKVYNKPNITVYHFKDGQGNEQGFTSQEFVLAMAGKRGTGWILQLLFPRYPRSVFLLFSASSYIKR